MQPLDLHLNGIFKSEMKEKFIKWYADECDEDEDYELTMSLKEMKPIHAEWLIDVRLCKAEWII